MIEQSPRSDNGKSAEGHQSSALTEGQQNRNRTARSLRDPTTWLLTLTMLFLASGVFAAIALESSSVMRITMMAIGAFHLTVGVAGLMSSVRGLYRSRLWNAVLVLIGATLLVGMPFADF